MSQKTPLGIGWTVEYSDEVPPTAASTWNTLAGVTGVDWQPTAAPDIDVTDTDSTQQETKTGLAGPGSFEITGLLDATAASNQPEVIGLQGSEQRHWRITGSKGVAGSSSGLVHTFIGTVQTARYGTSGVQTAATFSASLRVNDNTPGFVAEA